MPGSSAIRSRWSTGLTGRIQELLLLRKLDRCLVFERALRSEIIRGANLDDPGPFFVAYNRLASPDLAELIDLFVVRDLPLEQTDSSDLRILRNLYFAVEGYSFTSEDLQELFGGLFWYRPYRAFPNDVNALPESYRTRVEAIMRVEGSR